jgi:hypothetical protein
MKWVLLLILGARYAWGVSWKAKAPSVGAGHRLPIHHSKPVIVWCILFSKLVTRDRLVTYDRLLGKSTGRNTVVWVASELYRPCYRYLSAKLVPNFADRGCHVITVMDPHGGILGFLDLSRYFSFEVAPQLYSRGWKGPVPDPILFRKSGIGMDLEPLDL